MVDICNRTGCSEEAHWAPKINVPAKIMILQHNPEPAVTGILGLKLCDQHIMEVRLAEFPNIKDLISSSFKGMTPDWEGTWFTKVALDSEEFKAYEKN